MKRFISKLMVSFGLTMCLLSVGVVSAELDEQVIGVGIFCRQNAVCGQRIPCPGVLTGDTCGFYLPIIPDPNDPHLLVCRCG
jgi:hypothetical protein